MKSILILSLVVLLFACNNEKKPSASSDETTSKNGEVKTDVPPTPGDYTPISNLTYSAEGVEIKHTASILVSKDKDNLQAGLPYLCVLTSNGAKNNNEFVTVNFLLDTKPGTYPVVGASFMRGKDPNNEMYGGILGGKPKLTNYKVTLTECKDLGSNNLGGHKWSISGYWEEMTIDAAKMMLLDKTKNHPQQVKLGKGTFSNLSFDDNWEEMLEEGMKKLKTK